MPFVALFQLHAKSNLLQVLFVQWHLGRHVRCRSAYMTQSRVVPGGIRFAWHHELGPRPIQAVAALVVQESQLEVEISSTVAAAQQHLLRGQELDEGCHRPRILVAEGLIFLRAVGKRSQMSRWCCACC